MGGCFQISAKSGLGFHDISDENVLAFFDKIGFFQAEIRIAV